MKNLILFSFFLSFLTINLNAQDVREGNEAMSQGNNNALSISIPDLDEKQVGDIWKNYLKDFYDTRTKWDRKKKEWFSDDADIVSLGRGNTVDLYAVTESKGNDVILLLWVDLGGAYLSSEAHQDSYDEAERMLVRFALEAAREKVKMDIENEEKELKKLEGDLKKLRSAKERYEKTIEKAKQTIEKAEADIQGNALEQEKALINIDDQKELIETIRKKLNDI